MGNSLLDRKPEKEEEEKDNMGMMRGSKDESNSKVLDFFSKLL